MSGIGTPVQLSTSSAKYVTPSSQRVSFARSNGDFSAGTVSNSSKKAQTPSTSTSSRSLMHSGRSVTKSMTIPEKSSPINATPSGFKRVKITPQRMDSAFDDVDYDKKLKLLTNPKRLKVPSPQEKEAAVAAMANLFDEDSEIENTTMSAQQQSSPITQPTLQRINSSKKSPINSSSTTKSQISDHYDLMFAESSFIVEEASEAESNSYQIPAKDKIPIAEQPVDNPWIHMLNEAAESAKLQQPSVPPPPLPRQYRIEPTTDALVNKNGIDPSAFSSLLATLSLNHRQNPVLSSALVTPNSSSSFALNPSAVKNSNHTNETQHSIYPVSLPQQYTQFSSPSSSMVFTSLQMPSVKQSSKLPTNSAYLPDITIPTWSPSKALVDLDPSLEPYLEFLRKLDREFFSESNSASYRVGQDDALRLWQRYMLLPPDQLQESIFEQHQAMIDLGIFDQILSLEDKTKSDIPQSSKQ